MLQPGIYDHNITGTGLQQVSHEEITGRKGHVMELRELRELSQFLQFPRAGSNYIDLSISLVDRSFVLNFNQYFVTYL